MSASYDDRRVWQKIDGQLKDELILKIISSLECLICSELMHVPFLASCGHSFCYGCLDVWFETKVNCPTCRKDMKEPPLLNLSLKEHSKAISDLIIDTLEDQQLRAEMAQSRAQLIDDYEKASRSKSLFGKAFLSALTLVDTSDGVPRCGNCHWEAHGSVCLNCGVHFRHPRSDLYYDSEDGDAYNEDDEEVELHGVAGQDAYDTADSFVDDREDSDLNAWNEEDSDFNAWDEEDSDPNAWDGNGYGDLNRYSGEDDESDPNAWDGTGYGDLDRYSEDEIGSDDPINYVHDEMEEWENRRARYEMRRRQQGTSAGHAQGGFDDGNRYPPETQPWLGFSDDDEEEEIQSHERRMQRLDLQPTDLQSELEEQHQGDVGRFTRSERGKRRRHAQVISLESE